MSIFDRIRNKETNSQLPATLNNANLTPFEKYTKVKAFYQNNGAYDEVKRYAYNTSLWLESIKPIRTVVHRSVEFYVAKLIPDLRVVTEKQAVKESIEQFLKWSNFKAKKQVICRDLSLYGDLFLKVVGDSEHVYFEDIKPEFVTDFEEDTRGNLIKVRIDIPFTNEQGMKVYHTEFWSELDGYFAIWEHTNPSVDLDQLGSPKEYGFLAEMGIDFIPFVYIKFIDIGNKRGSGCVDHALDKIDEANRQATRLSELLFKYNRAYWALVSEGKAPALSVDAQDTILRENSIIRLGGADLKSLVPPINYTDALKVLQDMMSELEQDLPELKYYSLNDSQLSGKAISLLLAGAIDKAGEARENLIQGLIRLNEMALTIGRFWDLFPANIGTFDNGDFEHELDIDPMFSEDESERALLLKSLRDSGLGLSTAMELAGYEEEFVTMAVEEANQETLNRQQNLANALVNFNQA